VVEQLGLVDLPYNKFRPLFCIQEASWDLAQKTEMIPEGRGAQSLSSPSVFRWQVSGASVQAGQDEQL
jgi:hypothetical protein